MRLLLAEGANEALIVLLKVSRDLEETLALLFPEVDTYLIVALNHLQLLSQSFEFGHSLHLEMRFLFILQSHFIQLLLIDLGDSLYEVLVVVLTTLQLSDSLFLGFKESQNLAEIDGRQHLEFSSLRLELIESLGLGVLKLKQLLLLDTFTLDVILQPFNNLFLSGNLLLGPLDLLLENLLTFFGLGQLLPKGRVGAELLLEVVNLELVPLFLEHGFHHKVATDHSNDVLESEDFLSSLFLFVFQFLQLLKNVRIHGTLHLN